MSRTLLFWSSSVEKFLGEKGARGGGAGESFSDGSQSKDSGFWSCPFEAGRGAGLADAPLETAGLGAEFFGSGSMNKSRTRPTTLLKTLIALGCLSGTRVVLCLMRERAK
jgi:hypothetical protein